MEDINCISSFQDCGRALISVTISLYQPLFRDISKLPKFIINKKVVDHPNINNLLGNTQYEFRSSRSTADVINKYRISKALDSKLIGAIALNIAKVFDKIWHRGLLHKRSNPTTAECSQLSTSYRVGPWRSSLMAILSPSDQTGVTQRSLFSVILSFWLYVNGLFRSIFR